MASRVTDRADRSGVTRRGHRYSIPTDLAATTRSGRLALALLVVGFVISAYVVHIQLPANAVTLPYETSLRQPIRQILPQGWGFFTRSPREPDLLPFVRRPDGRWHNALRAPHSEARNAFGFARGSRTQGIEMGMLANGRTGDDWRPCSRPIAECLEQAPVIAVTSTAPAPTLCGDVGLASQPPPPWAWSRSRKAITMPGRVLRLVVSC